MLDVESKTSFEKKRMVMLFGEGEKVSAAVALQESSCRKAFLGFRLEMEMEHSAQP